MTQTFESKWAKASNEERKTLMQERQAQKIAQRRADHDYKEVQVSDKDHEVCVSYGYDKAVAKFIDTSGTISVFCNYDNIPYTEGKEV